MSNQYLQFITSQPSKRIIFKCVLEGISRTSTHTPSFRTCSTSAPHSPFTPNVTGVCPITEGPALLRAKKSYQTQATGVAK
ncbi:uncharacterized protein PITG_08108 [Phytophthora infestans T30-4]|uniref:Uncharacterized protein n=1 Tax=Phytophthora infestans (strain T30-4) TaxID=403677 RepID=D0N9H5_PHYIT|nr:uncharacterized protein PITG_08108 [Phytophthora infestans T30-4]EEY54463.1 hypothetical protein PITG_08108 [Phytophthora infestans T30-4]|eukprot:XP_002904285.1 hypothetical protein PITG_08108 [Phytophthora infestans T30-4]